MNLRFCALLASTLLSGCVLTDETNLTGGDFLAAHGLAAGDTSSRKLALPVESVEMVPMEGVPGLHGTEDIVLGSIGGDSIRLVLAFNLADSTLRNAHAQAHNDSLTRIRLVTRDAATGLSVRARFVFFADSNFLYGLLAGIEPAKIEIADTVLETEFVLPTKGADTAIYLDLPGTVTGSILARTRLIDSLRRLGTSGKGMQSWMAILLDTRSSTSGKSRFTSDLTLVGHDTAVIHDTSGTMSLGALDGNKTWRSIGFRPAGAATSFGWWPGGGNRLRARVDATRLRAAMHNLYPSVLPDTAGGLDNTFNVLQARVNVPLAKVMLDAGTGKLSITGSVLVDSGSSENQAPETFEPSSTQTREIPFDLVLRSEIKQFLNLKENPKFVIKAYPGMYSVQLKLDGVVADLPTSYSLARGSTTSWTTTKFVFPRDEVVEFRISSYLRVRLGRVGDNIVAKWWMMELPPVADDQSRSTDSLRHDAYLWSGASQLVQEIRTPFGKALNRNRPIEFDLNPTAFSNNSDRLIVEPKLAQVFDSVTVVARPLVGRNY